MGKAAAITSDLTRNLDWVIVQCLPSESVEVVPPLREAWREPIPKSTIGHPVMEVGIVLHLADMTSDLWRQVVVHRADDGGWHIQLAG